MAVEYQVLLVETTDNRTADWMMIDWIEAKNAYVNKELELLLRDKLLGTVKDKDGKPTKVFSKKICKFRVKQIWGSRDLEKMIWA